MFNRGNRVEVPENWVGDELLGLWLETAQPSVNLDPASVGYRPILLIH